MWVRGLKAMLFCASRPSPVPTTRRLDHRGAAGPLAAGANVERVEPLHERAVLVRTGDEIDGLRGGVDDRRAADADAPREVAVGATGLTDVRAGDRDNPCRGIRIVHEPERGRRRGIARIERVDAVVVGGDKDDIASADTRNVEPVDVQGLAVDLVVHRTLEELAELADVDVGCRKKCFGEVGAGPGHVVVLRGDARLSEDGRRQQQPARKG